MARKTVAAAPASTDKGRRVLVIQDLSLVVSPIGDEKEPVGTLILIDESKYDQGVVPAGLLPTHSIELKSGINPITRTFWFIYQPANELVNYNGGKVDQYELDVLLRKVAMVQIVTQFGKNWGRNYGFDDSTTEPARPFEPRRRTSLPDTYSRTYSTHSFNTVIMGQSVARNVLGEIVDPETTFLDSFTMYKHGKELNVTMDTDFEMRVQFGSVFHSSAHRWANDAVAEAIGEMSIGSISAYIALVGNPDFPVQPHQLDLPQLASEIEAKMFFLASAQKSKVVMLDTSASSFKFVEGVTL